MFASQIPFEIHLTVADVSTSRIDLFVKVCAESSGKPLLIELAQGEYRQQPMFSKVVYANDLKAVVAQAFHYSDLLKINGFSSKRLKIEIPAT